MEIKEELLQKIKQKRELSSLPDSFILPILEKHLTQTELKKSDKKLIVKLVRAELRRNTGMFQKTPLLKKRAHLLEQNNFQDILKTHTSTAERLPFYPELKKIISSLKPGSILDLGCGLNPLALATPEVYYYALDLQKSDLDIVEQFFKNNNIKGKIIHQDVLEKPENLPSADLCLMFKLLDIIDDKSHKKAQSLIEKIKCKHFIISFSTKTLSGKPMLHQKRPWLERILKNLKYNFSTIKSDNEIFYIIEKQ